MIISLTGFMGCGKSSIGKRLSELLCCRFMDLDEIIEEQTCRRITEIFASDGEERFRRLEKEALESVLSGSGNGGSSSVSSVLALGGGTVMTPGCWKMVHEGTCCVYLRTSVETLVERLTGEDSGRPLLKDPDSVMPGKSHVMSSEVETSALKNRILELMKLRKTTYEQVAHITIDTDGKSIREIAEEIISGLRGIAPVTSPKQYT